MFYRPRPPCHHRGGLASFLLLLAPVLLLAGPRLGAAMRVGPGTVDSPNPYEFVAKFAFDVDPVAGTPVGTVHGVVAVERPAFLAMYDDEKFSWRTVYKNASLDCAWALTTRHHGGHGPCKRKWRLEPGRQNVIDLRITEHIVPRLWYFAVIAETCGGGTPPAAAAAAARRRRLSEPAAAAPPQPRPLDLASVHWVAGTEVIHGASPANGLGKVTVDLTFLNIEDGWQRHFGFDELGVLPMTLVLCVCYALGFAYLMVTERKRMADVVKSAGPGGMGRRNSLAGRHRNGGGNPVTNASSSASATRAAPLVRIWSILVLLQLCALTLRAIDLAVYASKGTTSTRWHWGRSMTLGVFWHALEILSRLGLQGAVFLVARGWTISAGPGAVRGATGLGVLFVATCVVEIGSHVWICLTWDPASALYGYQGTTGHCVVAWRLFLLCWFLLSMRRTYAGERDEARRHLYRVFGLVFTLWFVAFPVVVVVVAPLIAPVWHYKVILGVVDALHMLALGAFGIIFWPAWSDKYFEVRHHNHGDGGGEGDWLMGGGGGGGFGGGGGGGGYDGGGLAGLQSPWRGRDPAGDGL